MSTHEYWDELAAGYALDALEPEEAAEFVEHLNACERCRQLVDEHSLVAAQLGSLAGDDVSPPPWSAVRAGIVGPAAGAGDDNVVPLRRRPRFAALTAAAAAVGVLALAGITWQLTRGNNGPQPLASASACRHASGCHVVALDTSAGTAAQLLVHDGRAAIVPLSMPAPPAGSVWALWQLPRGAAPVLLTEFTTGRPATDLKVGYGQTAGFAVSRENAGSTPAAPTDIVAAGNAV